MDAATVVRMDRRRSGRAAVRLVATLGILSIALLAACGGGEEAAPPAQEPTGTVEAQPPQDTEQPTATEPDTPTGTEPTPATTAEDGGAVALPQAVEQTRDAIVAAAHARDYEALEALLDPTTFSYSFGESGDPIGYWRRLEEEGEVPILGDILPVVLSMHHAELDDLYVWPAAHAKDPSTWTEEDLADLRLLYTNEDIRGFEQAGGYLGYRVGIQEDGAWIFFVAGD
jgi:hypothetical protein